MIRFKVVRLTGLFRSPVYEVESQTAASRDWLPMGTLGRPALVKRLDEWGVHSTESSQALKWASDAYRGGDLRWNYPEWGPLSDPPDGLDK